MLSFLAKPFGLILQFLYSIIGSYGLSIVILSAVIRLAMYPVYKKQIVSTSDMSEFSKKSQEIQKKYANDREMMNQKMAELQKETGYNPASGCLPILIQMVVISGLFVLLRYPLNYIQEESMVFAVHESFLWMKDLSQPDPWILPILSGIATFISFNMTAQNPLNAGGASNPTTKLMKYVFPVMIMWLAHSYPAGIAIYWFISQFAQIFFNLRFNKLRKEMQEEKEREERKEARAKEKAKKAKKQT